MRKLWRIVVVLGWVVFWFLSVLMLLFWPVEVLLRLLATRPSLGEFMFMLAFGSLGWFVPYGIRLSNPVTVRLHEGRFPREDPENLLWLAVIVLGSVCCAIMWAATQFAIGPAKDTLELTFSISAMYNLCLVLWRSFDTRSGHPHADDGLELPEQAAKG